MHTPSNSLITRFCSLYSHHLSDTGNAERFIAQFGAQVRYVPALASNLVGAARRGLPACSPTTPSHP